MKVRAALCASKLQAEERIALHIGLYSPTLPDSGASNGIVTYVRIMRDALRNQGHRVTVVTTEYIEHADGRTAPLPRQSPLIRNLGVLLERAQKDDGSSPWVRYHVLAAVKAARSAGVDIFEMEETHGWAGRLCNLGIPIIERLHGPHLYVRQQPETAYERRSGDLREAAEQNSFERVTAVTSPTQAMLDDLVLRYSLDLPLSRVIPNPVPVGNNLWNATRADPHQILCVGRFDRTKGADIILHAFAQACQQRPLRLVFAGPDPGITDEKGVRHHFEQFVHERIAPEARARISFIGPQPPEKINELRLKSGLALSGSRHETFAYSITEAMAVGMPVLTSATFAGIELVRDRINGRVVPVGNIEAMRDAMIEMAGDPQLLSRMGHAGLARARELLSPQLIAERSANFYREVIAERQRPNLVNVPSN